MQANHAGVPFIGPPRSYGKTPYPKRYITIHNTANDATARGEASYATRRTDGTSSHYYVDDAELIQSLNTTYGANHVASTTGNRHGISYEITGTNGKSRQWWLDNVAWDKLAASIAADCKDWGIPVRVLTTAQMKDGVSKGIITHNMARLAWGGTTHTDPGSNFPMDHLLSLVNAKLGQAQPGAPREVTVMFCKYGDTGPVVRDLQLRILAAGGAVGLKDGKPDLDGNYGDNTARGLAALVGGDGKSYGSDQEVALLVKIIKKQATGLAGPVGPAGPAGPPGKTPTKVQLGPVTATVIEAS